LFAKSLLALADGRSEASSQAPQTILRGTYDGSHAALLELFSPISSLPQQEERERLVDSHEWFERKKDPYL
jgi:hypothetical protein